MTLSEPGPDDVVVPAPSDRASPAALRHSCSAAACRRIRLGHACPVQEGDLPAPVKYGYLNVGVVEQGPRQLRGRTVFCLYPHQTAYVVPAGAVLVVPESATGSRRARGHGQTAVNALWDAAPLIGDRVAVVGAGMVGCCVARLLCRYPGIQVTLVDVEAGRGPSPSARRRIRAAGRRRRGRDLVVPQEPTSARLGAVARAARARRHRPRPQLVGTRGPALAGWGVPRGRLGIRWSQVGPCRRLERPPYAGRPARARA